MLSKKNCLVVGYGSIGSRHSRILQELGCDVAVVSRRVQVGLNAYASIDEAVRRYQPEYVVIANETALHHDALIQLINADYQGAVLMEKPLFDSSRKVPSHKFNKLRVAYNLRFHPVLVRLKSLLAGQSVLSVHSYVGQYLPNWRPGTDYKQSYSARSDMGGGALLDLSHDLDYLIWMLGDWVQVSALGGHMSALEITSDDLFSMLIRFSHCPVAAIQLNYLDRRGRRGIVVNTAENTYEADLIGNRLIIDATEELFSVERDDAYRLMHLAMLGVGEDFSCTIEEAMTTLHLIDASRQSSHKSEWITR
ncbi:Gfo/Idh/MocA family protein [Chromobacterium haemolyticum]|uniref:Gfo/Idh/MocA family protein n=1 Tax=Chromobacterium haemolyticum TaxID=394935 RepID=UPI0009DB6577|nr:Gfo/Idh/MocA family oxidoreductase [Chromobacterium haemolyticum]OQS42504.1 hypothetical protein B0T39_05515 [Chromobacterium haemolyticum]